MCRDSEESLVCLSESSRPRVPLCVRAFRLDEWRGHLGGWMTMPAVAWSRDWCAGVKLERHVWSCSP